jgi:hypothetical protein
VQAAQLCRSFEALTHSCVTDPPSCHHGQPRDCSAGAQAYALKRLARGLASGRGAARQGFALALAGALAALPTVPVRAVLDLLEAVLGAPASAKARVRLLAEVWVPCPSSGQKRG